MSGEAGPLIVFSRDQVRRLTGQSEAQLRSWDATGYFASRVLARQPRRAYGRLYLFRDVVGLRTLFILRHRHGIPMQELRKVARRLQQHDEVPWSALRLFVAGNCVCFDEPATDPRICSTFPVQTVLAFDLGAVELEMREQALRMRERRPDEIGMIVRHRDVVSNAWVLAGTRVPTAAVWNFHAAGADLATILMAYPSLTAIDVEKAVTFEEGRRRQRRAG